MKKIIALVLCCLFVFGISYADNKSDISKINKQVAQIEKTKANHGIRSIYMTTAKFSPHAIRYSENRPVDLYDRQRLSAVMKNMA